MQKKFLHNSLLRLVGWAITRGVPKMKLHCETWGNFTRDFQKSSLLEIHNVITFHQHKYKKGIMKATRANEI